MTTPDCSDPYDLYADGEPTYGARLHANLMDIAGDALRLVPFVQDLWARLEGARRNIGLVDAGDPKLKELVRLRADIDVMLMCAATVVETSGCRNPDWERLLDCYGTPEPVCFSRLDDEASR